MEEHNPDIPFFTEEEKIVHLGYDTCFPLDYYHNPAQTLLIEIPKKYRELMDEFEGPSKLKAWRRGIKDMIIQIMISIEDFFENKPGGPELIHLFKFPNPDLPIPIMEELENELKTAIDDWMITYKNWPAYGFEHMIPFPSLEYE